MGTKKSDPIQQAELEALNQNTAEIKLKAANLPEDKRIKAEARKTALAKKGQFEIKKGNTVIVVNRADYEEHLAKVYGEKYGRTLHQDGEAQRGRVRFRYSCAPPPNTA